MRVFGSSRPPKHDLAVAAGVPAAGAGSAAVRRTRPDREFLPAALEILESPPSPIHMALILVICCLVLISLVWSWFGRIDIVAVAGGKIQPPGRVKTVQSVETGRVKEILVTNGRHVEAGDVLFRLDPAEARADEAESATNLASFSAEVLRRDAALASMHTPAPVPIAWPVDTPPAVVARENAILASDLSQLHASVANLQAQLNQKRAERKRLEETIAAQSALVATLKERVDMRSTLLSSGSGSKASLLDARENYETQAANLAYQTGQRFENEAAIAVAQSEIDKAYGTFAADNSAKRGEAERQAEDHARKLDKARVRTTQMVVVASTAGVVQGSTITTTGQVVNTGEEVMRIVPEYTSLEVEAYLPNKDVGFVRQGQDAVVKVESFPFTRYGTLKGKVVRVASDAIPEPDADLAEAAPARAARNTNLAGGQHTQSLVYPIIVELNASSIQADERTVALTPGMAVTAEIKTGSRRMIDYLLAPVMEVSSTAMRER